MDVPHVIPSLKLYSAVKPVTTARAGTVMAVLQVLLTTGAAGAAGKTTKFFVSLQLPVVVVNVAVKHPAVVGVNIPVVEPMVPPPLTVHVPAAVPVLVKVTVEPPAQEFCTVMTGCSYTLTVIQVGADSHKGVQGPVSTAVTHMVCGLVASVVVGVYDDTPDANRVPVVLPA